MSVKVKLIWVVVGVAGLFGVGYLASRVGNIAARGVRDGGAAITLAVSEPIVPGVSVRLSWNTALGQEAGPVVLQARGTTGEVTVGRSEFGTGQAMIEIPCAMDDQPIAILLAAAAPGEPEELLAWTRASVLPAGPDCLR